MKERSIEKQLPAVREASVTAEIIIAGKEVSEKRANPAKPTLELLAASLALTGLLAAAPVHAESFEFSFQGDPTLGLSGTVEGIITGLSSAGTSSALTVSITEYPAALTGLPSVPLTTDIPNPSSNQFTVSGGTVTAANFYGSVIGSSSDFLDLNLSGGTGIASLNGDSNVVRVYSPPTFTLLPVPELPIPLMLSSGMLVALLARRRRKREQASLPDNLAL
jgi:hypothetical protein